MRLVALLAIRIYQRFVSPYKGFHCAYQQHTGGASCSAFGHRAVQRFGIWNGSILIRRRLARCGEIFRHNIANTRATRPPLGLVSRGAKHAQMGFVDGCDGAGCEGCNGCEVGELACDVASCADCDFFSWPRSQPSLRYGPRPLGPKVRDKPTPPDQEPSGSKEMRLP